MWTCRIRGLALCGMLLFAGQAAPAWAADDPFEDTNRWIHGFNRAVQTMVLNPLVEAYHAVAPERLRLGIGNAMTNLAEPMTAVTGLFAGRFELAANAVTRFGINSTIGIVGIHDRASEMGYPRQRFTAADTLCSWGVPSGPFLVLPLLGPSSLRDAGARIGVALALSEVLGSEPVLAFAGSEAFVGYAQIHDEVRRVEADSLDPYAVYRSAYRQQRAAMCETDRQVLMAGAEEDESDTR
ncbi:MlaA family lipoprotein [Humitalea sp. 24SJ18S-53]|uniref:MlaA family lipoprotein n=1 Tax=Humitalea sp. 24SJ18S-53 TaxID=3422307 RepID=UPI003D66AA1D